MVNKSILQNIVAKRLIVIRPLGQVDHHVVVGVCGVEELGDGCGCISVQRGDSFGGKSHGQDTIGDVGQVQVELAPS